jgi:hypothetical protein
MKFQSEADVEAYVAGEASKALPPGWVLERPSRDQLVWVMAPDAGRKNLANYILEVSRDLGKFVVYFGNTDAGPLRLSHFLLNGKVIAAEALDRFPLATVIADVIGHCELNRWGLT